MVEGAGDGDDLSRSPRLGRPFTMATLIVIVLFGVVTFVVDREARTIDSLAASIGADALARIDALVTARGELHRATSLSSATANQRFRNAFSRIRPLLTDASEPLANELDAAVERWEETNQSQAATIEVDQAFERMIRDDAAHARRLGEQIQSTRREASRLSIVLYASVALLTLLIVALASRIARSTTQLATERARLHAERKQLAERRAEELEMFARRVAHDLKQPLQAILLSSSTITQPSASAELMRSSAARISEVAARMSRLLDETLQFAKSGGEPERSARTDLHHAIATAVADVETIAARDSILITVDPVPPIALACPAGPLHSILGNLVGNAVKFVAKQAERRIAIHVDLERHAPLACVIIEDTGPGVAPELADSIWDPHVRAPRTRGGGFGLGLATVKRLVNAYGGEVGVISLPRAGCRFWFSLPIAGVRASLTEGQSHSNPSN